MADPPATKTGPQDPAGKVTHARLRRLARPLQRWTTQIFAVLIVVGVVLALWGQRDAIRGFDWSISPVAVAASVALFTVPVFAQGLSWWLILRLMGARSGPWPSFLVWMRGFLARYAPSGALTFAVRVRERERMGLTTTQVMVASGYEQLAAPLAGAIVAVAAFLLSGTSPNWLAVAILAVLVGVAVGVRPAWGGRLLERLAARRGLEIGPLLRGRFLALAVAVNVVAWPFAGLAAWVLLDALTPDPPGFWGVLAAYAFAWLLGVIVPILPGGLGLRDATLASLLAPAYGLGVATTLALALRLVNTLGEFAAIGATEAAGLLPAARHAAHPERRDDDTPS